jgi:hypothetical protein
LKEPPSPKSSTAVGRRLGIIVILAGCWFAVVLVAVLATAKRLGLDPSVTAEAFLAFGTFILALAAVYTVAAGNRQRREERTPHLHVETDVRRGRRPRVGNTPVEFEYHPVLATNVGPGIATDLRWTLIYKQIPDNDPPSTPLEAYYSIGGEGIYEYHTVEFAEPQRYLRPGDSVTLVDPDPTTLWPYEWPEPLPVFIAVEVTWRDLEGNAPLLPASGGVRRRMEPHPQESSDALDADDAQFSVESRWILAKSSAVETVIFAYKRWMEEAAARKAKAEEERNQPGTTVDEWQTS